MTEVASTVVHDVIGRRIQDVDQPIVDYIVNVLADEDFDFGVDGEGAFEALGELLVDSGCVTDDSECRSVRIDGRNLPIVQWYSYLRLIRLLSLENLLAIGI